MSPRPFRLRDAEENHGAPEPISSPTSFRRRDVFAGIRVLLALLALAVTLTSSWPYMYLEREPDDPLRGAEAWTNRRSLSFPEVTKVLPREPAWLLLPVIVIGLAVWERYEARLRRSGQLGPSRIGAATRLVLFLVLACLLILWTFNVDLTHRWSVGPAKQLIDMCGWLGLAGVLMDMVAVNRESAAAAAKRY